MIRSKIKYYTPNLTGHLLGQVFMNVMNSREWLKKYTGWPNSGSEAIVPQCNQTLNKHIIENKCVSITYNFLR